MAEPTALKPGEIAAEALSLYGRYWRALLGAMLAVIAPLHLLGVIGVLALSPDLFSRTNQDLLTALQDEETSTLAAFAGLWVLEVVAFAFALAACLVAFVGARAGAGVSGRASLAAAFERPGRIIMLSLVFVAVVATGLVLWIVPGVWIATLWSLALPVLVVERTTVGAAFARSRELVRGRFWPILGVIAVAFVATLLLSLILGGIAGGFASALSVDGNVAGAVTALIGGIAGNVVSVPLLAAVIAVIYADERTRKQGAQPPLQPLETAEPGPFGGWHPPVPPTGS